MECEGSLGLRRETVNKWNKKGSKSCEKKTLLQVARALEAGRRKDGEPLEMDDSDLEDDVDDSYVVNTSDNSNSVVHESLSESEEVVMEDDESNTPSQRRSDAFFSKQIMRYTTVVRSCQATPATGRRRLSRRQSMMSHHC
jgi:hypothetical protein